LTDLQRVRLGVNVDHVATIRNARGGRHPDPLRAARAARAAGADSITAHLREDRRHINDDDIARLRGEIDLLLNMEMAPTEEMQAIALRAKPFACCLVPERRQELTTEGGLDVLRMHNQLPRVCRALRSAGIRVSLFVEPEPEQIEAARAVGADAVELHTGSYCDAVEADRVREAEARLARLRDAARAAHTLGLEVHAGHGLTYGSVGAVAAIPEIVELNIGHFLIGEALFVGLERSIGRMRGLIDEARAVVVAADGSP
jgi:pyridoxine 5-phosphate synthase